MLQLINKMQKEQGGERGERGQIKKINYKIVKIGEINYQRVS
jgi:hypothetical protein